MSKGLGVWLKIPHVQSILKSIINWNSLCLFNREILVTVETENPKFHLKNSVRQTNKQQTSETYQQIG